MELKEWDGREGAWTWSYQPAVPTSVGYRSFVMKGSRENKGTGLLTLELILSSCLISLRLMLLQPLDFFFFFFSSPVYWIFAKDYNIRKLLFWGSHYLTKRRDITRVLWSCENLERVFIIMRNTNFWGYLLLFHVQWSEEQWNSLLWPIFMKEVSHPKSVLCNRFR